MKTVKERLIEAGCKVTEKTCNGFVRYITEVSGKTVEVDCGFDGKVIRSSKYAYKLPESVGDDVRLA